MIGGGEMEHLLRLFLVCGLVASAILIVAVGLARHDAYLVAPAHLIVSMIGLALYLLPAALAWHRNCEATVWITLVDVLLGWTVLGWVVSIWWAVKGKVRTLPPPAAAAHSHPVAGH